MSHGDRVRVLIVDDDPGIRELVSLALTDEGYEVMTAAHGGEALEQTAMTHPNVILVDTRMPIMDAPTFIQSYRSQPGPHAPIIVVTAAHDAQAVAAEVQADAVLEKPFDLDRLLDLVARYSKQS